MNSQINLNKKNESIDAFKFILSLCIVFHHIYCNLKRWNYADNEIDILIYGSGMYFAVDAFFIISGFFLYGSYERKNKNGVSLASYVVNRYKRLIPEFVIVLLLNIIIDIYLSNKINYSLIIPSILFISDINGIGTIVSGAWYVSCLFFISIFFFWLLIKFNDVGKFYIYIFCFISLSIIVTKFKSFGLFSQPLYLHFSGGFY